MRKVTILLIACIGISACATSDLPPLDNRSNDYTVKPQDNFYSIAFAFEITVEQLMAANPWLSPSNIAPGMRLTIPATGSSTPAAGSGQKVRFVWPLKRRKVSSDYGYRNGSLHAGIDLSAARGTRVYASAAGKVTFSGRQNGYGQMVVLDHGNGLQTVYAHNHHNLVSEGEFVRQGQTIASVGRSGNASGYHLHFEIRRSGTAVVPWDYLPR